MIDRLFPDVPRPAVWLGLAGLIPFYACAIGSYVLPYDWNGRALDWMVAYGAIILSFLGGVHWGLATGGFGAPAVRDPALEPPASMTWQRLGWSVVPSIIAWLAHLLFSWQPAFLLLAAGFIGMLYGDVRAVQAGLAPAWYLTLRRHLTWLVVAALTAGIVRPLLSF